MRTAYLVGIVVLILVVAIALYLAMQPGPTQVTPPSPSPMATTRPPVQATVPTQTLPTSPVMTTTPVTTSPASGPGGQIIMCVIYNAGNALLKAQADAIKFAVNEINRMGGIAGRQVVLLEENHQGKADIAVAAYRRLVVERGCRYVFIDGVSEIALAVEDAAAAVYPTYPHIVMSPGQAAMDTTLKVINDYNRYKFYFRPFSPDPDLNFVNARTPFYYFKNMFKINRIALFIEDAAWTACARGGCTITSRFGNYSFSPLRELAREYGLEVVYEVNIAVGEKNFIPILEEAARRGAEAIYVVSSWYTDVISLVKQWSVSSARNILLFVGGGPNAWREFWNMTGGAALGVLTFVYNDPQYPFFRGRPLVIKATAAGYRVDAAFMLYYSAVYWLKAAIDRAGNPDDIEGVIKMLESIRFENHTLYSPVSAYLGSRDYRFHSVTAVPGGVISQFQCNGKIVYLGMREFITQYISENEVDWNVVKSTGYKWPAQLREECK